MSVTSPTETEMAWLDKIIYDQILASAQRIREYEDELRKYPNGPIRIALHPRLVAERLFHERLATLRPR